MELEQNLMQKAAGQILSLSILVFGSWACGKQTVTADFKYGQNFPGLACTDPSDSTKTRPCQRGGHLLFESINAADGVQGLGSRTQAHMWFRTRTEGVTPLDPQNIANQCNQRRLDPMGNDFPPGPAPIPPGTNFVDLGPTVTLTPVEGDTSKVFTLNQFTMGAMGAPLVDNLSNIEGIIYGGNKQQGPFPFDQYQAKTHYRVQFKGPDADADSSLVQFKKDQMAGEQPELFAPDRFQVLTPKIGQDATVMIPAGQDFTITWVPDETVDATVHTPERSFPFIQIAGLMNGKPHHAWFCPMNDGKVHSSFTIPKEIIANMDPGGIIQMGQLTHVMAKFTKTAADGHTEDLRWDIITVACNTSNYQIQ